MIYRKPVGIETDSLNGMALISTLQGGRVVCEPRLIILWQLADGCSLEEISVQANNLAYSAEEIQPALACLAEAGLLVREGWSQEIVLKNVSPVHPGSVSVVIVSYDSQEWLAECLPSVFDQTVKPAEVVLVDNASPHDPTNWVQEHFPEVQTIRLAQMHGLASAINRGVEQTKGEFILILNPDVRLELDAVAQMQAVAASDEGCAAVAPKLKFWWAPAFLNGIGNQAGFFKWGSDNGLGHLDLGQFDGWDEVPSACFAAALIRRSAWEGVGPSDEEFRFYYEDTEWSYRARLLGWRVRAAPKAVVYHAFGRRIHTGQEKDLTPSKLRSVVYGRLRFVGKITTGMNLLRYSVAALIHDTGRALLLLLRGEWQESAAILSGWSDFIAGLPDLRRARKSIQARRVQSDAEIFSLQRDLPPPVVWRGLPKLTLEIIDRHYLPAIRAGMTRSLPEFENKNNAGQTP